MINEKSVVTISKKFLIDSVDLLLECFNEINFKISDYSISGIDCDVILFIKIISLAGKNN